ncbi:hypothetical protein F5B18DRAFT_672445 [Nemania serpens]|nr:hypothetical protein F5B18DRAFT_672445 [Nemania serpens]
MAVKVQSTCFSVPTNNASRVARQISPVQRMWSIVVLLAALGWFSFYEVEAAEERRRLKLGIKSGIEAVIRRPNADGEDKYAWEMLIVRKRDASAFCVEEIPPPLF